MGVTYMATADLQDISFLSDETSLTTISSDYARTGTYSFKKQWNSYHVIPTGSVSSSYIRFSYLRSAATSQSNIIYMIPAGGSTATYQFRFTISDSLLEVYRYTSTLLDSQPIVATYGKWNTIEMYFVIHDSSGIVQIKLNGQLIVNINGVDTQGQAGSTVNRAVLHTANTSVWNYIDDIIVRDDQWPGRGGIYVMVPNSGSATENWTASAGNPEDCVDELPVSTADYIGTPHTPSEVEHLFNVASPPVSGNINAIGTYAYMLTDAATEASGRNIIRSNSIMGSGDYVGVDVGGRWITNYFDVDPATGSDWSFAAVENLEIGVEN